MTFCTHTTDSQPPGVLGHVVERTIGWTIALRWFPLILPNCPLPCYSSCGYKLVLLAAVYRIAS